MYQPNIIIQINTLNARQHLEKLFNKDFQDALQAIYDKEKNSSDMDKWKIRLIEWYLLEIRTNGYNIQDLQKRKILGSWGRFIDEYSAKLMFVFF